MDIRAFSHADDEALFDMMRQEGPEWEDYYGEETSERYRQALRNSRTYVALEDDTLCGYVRCRDDDGFGIYVYDLLVGKPFRGRGIGRKLLDRVCADYPHDDVYVMSDADGYYSKQGYRREGSIFVIRSRPGNRTGPPSLPTS